MTDEEHETAARIAGSIVMVFILLAAAYPVAYFVHVAYRLALAGWHA